MRVLAACSVLVYALTGEDALDLPTGQVPGDGTVTRRFAWGNDVVAAAETPAKMGT